MSIITLYEPDSESFSFFLIFFVTLSRFLSLCLYRCLWPVCLLAIDEISKMVHVIDGANLNPRMDGRFSDPYFKVL